MRLTRIPSICTGYLPIETSLRPQNLRFSFAKFNIRKQKLNKHFFGIYLPFLLQNWAAKKNISFNQNSDLFLHSKIQSWDSDWVEGVGLKVKIHHICVYLIALLLNLNLTLLLHKTPLHWRLFATPCSLILQTNPNIGPLFVGHP